MYRMCEGKTLELKFSIYKVVTWNYSFLDETSGVISNWQYITELYMYLEYFSLG